MSLKSDLEMKYEVSRLQVGRALSRVKREEREAMKEHRPVPPSLRAKLEAEVRDARATANGYAIALESVNRVPPIARAL